MSIFNISDKTYKKIDSIIYLFLIFFMLIFHINLSINSVRNNFCVNLSFLLIGCLSYLFYMLDKKKLFSVFKIFNIFNFIFFYLAAFNQYTTNTVFWGMADFLDSDYLFGNVIILLYIVIVNSFMFYHPKSTNFKTNYVIKNKITNYFIFYIMTFLFIILLRQIDNSLFNMLEITLYFSIPLLLCITILSYRENKFLRKKQFKYLIGVEFIIFLIVFNPFLGKFSRFLLFGAYIVVFCTLCMHLKLKSLLLVLFILGFGIVFPLFNVFKFGNSLADINILDFDYFNFNFVDYDAYLMFLSTIRYANDAGFCFGHNLMSGIFSFVPRDFWVSKLYPTGQIVAEYIGSSFTNLSSPLIGEFYFSFGVFGVVIFSIIFGFLIRLIDNKMYTSIFNFVANSTLCGVLIIFLRGAMLPAFNFIYFELIALAYIKAFSLFYKEKIF